MTLLLSVLTERSMRQIGDSMIQPATTQSALFACQVSFINESRAGSRASRQAGKQARKQANRQANK